MSAQQRDLGISFWIAPPQIYRLHGVFFSVLISRLRPWAVGITFRWETPSMQLSVSAQMLHSYEKTACVMVVPEWRCASLLRCTHARTLSCVKLILGLLRDMIPGGNFTLSPPQRIQAWLSCFVFQQSQWTKLFSLNSRNAPMWKDSPGDREEWAFKTSTVASILEKKQQILFFIHVSDRLRHVRWS